MRRQTSHTHPGPTHPAPARPRRGPRAPLLRPALLALLMMGATLLALLMGGAALPACAARGQDGADVAAQPTPTLEEMTGQMLLVGFRGTDAPDGSPVARAITEEHVAGVVLFDYDTQLKQPGRNIASPAQLDALTARLRGLAGGRALILSVDQEGGRVQRLKERGGFTPSPSAAELGRTGLDTAPTFESARALGAQLARHGLNLDFAPVLDVDVNPASPAIGALGRSFSADPAIVAAQGAAFLDGLHAAGVLGCVKHFPGHGSAGTDSHTGLPDITDTWTDMELTPFAAVIAAGRADLVMTAHLFDAKLDPELPATLSPAVVTGLLRDRLGWRGVVVTDDLDMAAVSERYTLAQRIRLAVDAGCDLLLFGNNLHYDPDVAQKAHAALLDLVRRGVVSEARVRQSYERIRALLARLAPGPDGGLPGRP